MKKPEPAAQLAWRLLPASVKHLFQALEAASQIPRILIELGDRVEALEEAAKRDRDPRTM